MSEANIIPMPGSTAARIPETGVLLEYPRYTGSPQRHDVIYGFVGGRVGTAPLARYRLPEEIRGRVLIAPASADTDGLQILPMLATIADRVAPWVKVHVVPRILKKREQGDDFARAEGSYEVDGRSYSAPGGVATTRHNLVLLKLGAPVWMAHSLCHELLHAVWCNLSAEARDVLEEAVAEGPAWPGGYYSDPEERAARAFEAWAWARIEGAPPGDVELMTVGGIFEFVWSGGLADHQIQRGLVPNAEALLVRRGLHPLLPPEPEPPPAPPPRPRIDDVICDAVWDALAAGVRGISQGVRRAWREVAAAA